MSTENTAPTRPIPEWMRQDDKNMPKIGLDELTSLSALICYIAHRQKIGEFAIERRLADHFHLPSLQAMPALFFEAAIRYLVDTFPVA